jgi:DNA polymerase-3 subunit beta
MKFVCSQEKLVKSLNIVTKAVSSRTTLPILKGLLIKANEEEGKIKLSASDLEISIETSLEGEIEEGGSVVLSAKLFSEIIRKLPSEKVSVEIKEGEVAEIKSGNAEFVLQGIDAEEFPKIESGEEESSFSLDREMLRDMIKSTAFAASIEESRGIITGVLLEIKRTSVSMVALDGYRMAVAKEEVTGTEEKNIVISARVLQEIGKLLSEETDEESVIINTEEKKAAFLLKNTKIICRVLEGEFIKYYDILPKDSKTHIVIDRNYLLESVERASIIVREGKNSFIRFSMAEEELIISSRADEGTIKDSIPVHIEGDGLDIGFNARFIGDTLKAIKDEKVKIEFNTSISPCVVKPVEGDAYAYLILPVRLSTGNI